MTINRLIQTIAVTALAGALLTACGSEDTTAKAETTWNSTSASTQQAWCLWGKQNNLAGAGKALAGLAKNKFGYEVDYLDAMDVIAAKCGMQ